MPARTKRWSRPPGIAELCSTMLKTWAGGDRATRLNRRIAPSASTRLKCLSILGGKLKHNQKLVACLIRHFGWDRPLGTGMGRIIDREQAVALDFGIDLRRRQGRMSKQLLDLAQVGTG